MTITLYVPGIYKVSYMGTVKYGNSVTDAIKKVLMCRYYG